MLYRVAELVVGRRVVKWVTSGWTSEWEESKRVQQGGGRDESKVELGPIPRGVSGRSEVMYAVLGS